LVEAVRDAGVSVVWACDPMHGNTFAAASGRKTRRFDDILDEVRSVLRRAPNARHLAERSCTSN
jgi:3-deoxy-7-phosphoheptulonate synthase